MTVAEHNVSIVDEIATCTCGWYCTDDSSDQVGLEVWKREHEASASDGRMHGWMTSRYYSQRIGHDLTIQP